MDYSVIEGTSLHLITLRFKIAETLVKREEKLDQANFYSTFAQHSFDISTTNLGQNSKPKQWNEIQCSRYSWIRLILFCATEPRWSFCALLVPLLTSLLFWWICAILRIICCPCSICKAFSVEKENSIRSRNNAPTYSSADSHKY